MSRTIEKTVFKFDELSDAAKEKAREWYRRAGDNDDSYADHVIEDLKQCASIMGIEVDKTYWSGFWSQGDGASFTGSYRYAKGGVKAIKAHASQDKELHRIAQALQDAQRVNFYRLQSSISAGGYYSHSGTMVADTEDTESRYRDIGAAEDDLLQAFRDLADWFYTQLESAYEWENADEQVDENICANEYEFDEYGTIV